MIITVIFTIMIVVFCVSYLIYKVYNPGELIVVCCETKDDNSFYKTYKMKFKNENQCFFICGSGTVWSFTPSGKRCGTGLEYDICEAIAKFKINESTK